MDVALDLFQQICAICLGILLRSGPFLKEAIYQDLLIYELRKLGIETTREMVFSYSAEGSDGNRFTICNGQFLRTDVELPSKKCIVELKATTASTKDEQIWQLRNYLENREDRDWGILVNFISKFGPRTSPKVQCDFLYKTDEYYETSSNVRIRKYAKKTFESEGYPMQDEIIENISDTGL